MKNGFMFGTLFLVAAAVYGGTHPGESPCSWECGLVCQDIIHQGEMENPQSPRCRNHNVEAGIGTQHGNCQNDFVGPSWNMMTCGDSTGGCIGQGKLKCVYKNAQGQVTNVTFPSAGIYCGHKTIQGQVVDPFMSMWESEWSCLYADGSGQAVGCPDTPNAPVLYVVW